jgi:hypothetical protein
MLEIPFLIEAQTRNLIKHPISQSTQNKGLTEKQGRKLKVSKEGIKKILNLSLVDDET